MTTPRTLDLPLRLLLAVSSFTLGTSTSCNTVPNTAANASGAGTTAGVLCDTGHSSEAVIPSAGVASVAHWSCRDGKRTLSANGLPNHPIGTFPNENNPNTISAQQVHASYTLSPALTGAAAMRIKELGHALNGIKFDPGTAGRCDESGRCSPGGGYGAWNMEALGSSPFKFGLDENNAHVQPGGVYHYHGVPSGLVNKLNKSNAMTLVGWAADGFPIYSRYGHEQAGDARSATKILLSSYRLRATPSAGRPSSDIYPMGAFSQDYMYQAGSGDLDECNGREGVTPEFPGGIYHYVVTDAFPFIGRCVKGTPALRPGGPPRGGQPRHGAPPPRGGWSPHGGPPPADAGPAQRRRQ